MKPPRSARALQLERLNFLVRNDLRSRFVGNALGFAWAALIPLLQLALFAVVFGWILQARVPGLEGLGYTAFLALGMWPWFAFSESVMRGSTALSDNAGLITKVSIAPWQLVAARTITAFMLHASGYLLVLLVLSLIGAPIVFSQLALPVLGWLLLIPLAFSLGLIAALLQLFVRDLQQLIPLVLSAGLFLSPILYSSEMAPPVLRSWLAINPLVGVVSATRDALLGHVELMALATAALSVLLICLLAAVIYRRLHAHVEDFL